MPTKFTASDHQSLHLILVWIFALLAMGWPRISATAQTREIDMGIITRRIETQAKPISVTSETPKLQDLLIRAFETHGAYRVAPLGESDFTFRLTALNDTAVRLSIESGKPLKALFTRDVSGRNWQEATLRAGDLAVIKTLGIPGYFAGQLAFISNRSSATEVYISDLLFQSVRQITRDGADCVGPQLSPNGRELLYTSYYRNGFPDIYRIDLTSGRRAVFSSFEGINTGATYNPRGDKVAMILSGSGNPELYVSDTLGRNIHRLTRSISAVEADPSWSPDGRRILFTSDQLGKPQIFQVPAQGGAVRRVPANISSYCAEPDWNKRNPDLIAFTAAQGKEFEVALFAFSTGRSRVLTHGRGDAIEPTWSNDGRHLIYTERIGRKRRLLLLDTETGKKTALHRDEFGNTFQAYFSYLRQ